MDSLFDILSDKDFDAPPEIQAIKKYVRDTYNAAVSVSIRERDILVIVPSSSLAGRLRFDMPKIKELLHTDKRIVLRIG